MILDPYFYFFTHFVYHNSTPSIYINITNLDTSEVWLPPHPSDFGLGDKKSHFWQNAPVTDWSKEQVSHSYLKISYRIMNEKTSIKNIIYSFILIRILLVI